MNAEIIVVGAGSNSLTTACYLAKAGLKVLVLEREEQCGGGAFLEYVEGTPFKALSVIDDK